MTHPRTFILDIPFDHVTLVKALEKTLGRLHHHESKPLFIATPNPEMLLEARRNKTFHDLLQHTDLNIADGFGIILASKLTPNPLKERVTGTDFMQQICKHAPDGTRIFLLGAAPGVAEKTKEKLASTYPQLKIVGTHAGSPAPDEDTHIRQLINHANPEILFVAYGAPNQELWLARNLPHLHTVKVAMGIGGAFDFISGTIKRAPLWMRKLGIEWLYRLIKQPSRIKRIFNATIKFPLVFLFSKKKSTLHPDH